MIFVVWQSRKFSRSDNYFYIECSQLLSSAMLDNNSQFACLLYPPGRCSFGTRNLIQTAYAFRRVILFFSREARVVNPVYIFFTRAGQICRQDTHSDVCARASSPRPCDITSRPHTAVLLTMICAIRSYVGTFALHNLLGIGCVIRFDRIFIFGTACRDITKSRRTSRF